MKKLFLAVVLTASLLGSSFVAASQAGQLPARVANIEKKLKATQETVEGLKTYFADKTPEQVHAFFEYVEAQIAESNAPSRFNVENIKVFFEQSKVFCFGSNTRTAVTLSTAALVALVTYWYAWSNGSQEENGEGFEVPVTV